MTPTTMFFHMKVKILKKSDSVDYASSKNRCEFLYSNSEGKYKPTHIDRDVLGRGY